MLEVGTDKPQAALPSQSGATDGMLMNSPGELRVVVVQALALLVAGAVAGVLLNLLRSAPVAWIADRPYTILVPCPEQVGDAMPLEPGDARIVDGKSLVVDARTRPQFEAWHLPGAWFVQFDWLGPPVDEEVAQIARRIAESGARRLVVYGDGDDPDSGKQWARLMAGAKLKNVLYVRGGAPQLKRRVEESRR